MDEARFGEPSDGGEVLGDREEATELVSRAWHVLGLPDPKSPNVTRKRSAPKKRRT